MSTKIDIFSGFLGSGKTTLIKKLLNDGLQNENVVLIENEFGEIGIDGDFLKEAGIEIKEMNSGCICCSLVGDFREALAQVVETYKPERILIEPSGVGKLSDVIRAVTDIAEHQGLDLNSYCCVVDVTKAKMYMKNFGEFYNNQITYASTIVLSRTQKVSEEKVEEIVAMIRELNKEATVITTPWDELTGATILEALENKTDFVKELLEEEEICPECGHHHHHDEECECGHEHHHHDHDEEEHEHHHHHHHDEDHDEDEHEHHHHHDEECECGHHHHHHHDHDEECGCGHHHHHHHHDGDEVFTSWGKETPKHYSHDELEAILKALSTDSKYGTILRAKGMVASDNTWLYFDLTPEEYEIREGAALVTGRLCVIGAEIKEDELENLF